MTLKGNTMRTTPVSYLVDKTHLKQKALTLRIPQHVHEALHATRERADSAGFVFDIQAVVVEALVRAVDRVATELGVQTQGEGVRPVGQAKAGGGRRQRKPGKPVSAVEAEK